MSGSIGGSRIPTKAIKPTVNAYIEKVLSGFKGYKNCDTTGSYNVIMKLNQEKPNGHGDIDLVVHIEHDDIKKLKKEFSSYCNSLPDDVTVPFKDGKRKGQKSQLFGTIVTVGFPIYGDESKYVQIDNILVTTENDKVFQKSFLDMNAQKQALFQGLVRVLLQHEDKERIFKHFNLENLPQPSSDQEFEFVLSTAGLSLRLVTLTPDRKEKERIELWRSNNWDDVRYLMKDYDFDGDYNDCLKKVDKRITDARSRNRIVGIIKSMIRVGPGEVGTPKGDDKQSFIDLAEKTLSMNENNMHSLKDFINESKHMSLSDFVENS